MASSNLADTFPASVGSKPNIEVVRALLVSWIDGDWKSPSLRLHLGNPEPYYSANHTGDPDSTWYNDCSRQEQSPSSYMRLHVGWKMLHWPGMRSRAKTTAFFTAQGSGEEAALGVIRGVWRLWFGTLRSFCLCRKKKEFFYNKFWSNLNFVKMKFLFLSQFAKNNYRLGLAILRNAAVSLK